MGQWLDAFQLSHRPKDGIGACSPSRNVVSNIIIFPIAVTYFTISSNKLQASNQASHWRLGLIRPRHWRVPAFNLIHNSGHRNRAASGV